MTPRLRSVWFRSDSKQYERLARVLDYTARKHCPGWDVDVREVAPPYLSSPAGWGAAANHRKLEVWVREVNDAPDGTVVALLDADTFVTNALDPVLSLEFDVAYTARPAGCRLPLNGGVVFVRVGNTSRKFMSAWLATDREFLTDLDTRAPWRKRYGGQNQASFGHTLETEGAFYQPSSLLPLSCAEWNCEDATWDQFDSGRTRVVHVKSALRMEVFNIVSTAAVKPLARLWSSLEREAG